MKQIIIILLIMAAASRLYAQEIAPDSIHTLESFTVSSSRLSQFTAGTKQMFFEAGVLQQHVHQSLADLLSNESSMFVKSYGSGTLASVSLRGTNAHHTAVLWNGFNINSPMNGQMDLSLVPAGLYDVVNIQYGGSSSLWGSGAIGGAIHINNKPYFNKGTAAKLILSGGSFGTLKQSAEASVSRKKLSTSIKLYNSLAENNFEYTNHFVSNKPLIKQNHAKVAGKGLMAENNFLINERQKINFLIWLQKAERNIPPSMLEAESKAHQIDNNLKLSSEWILLKNRTTVYARGAYFDDKQNYNDSLSLVYAINSFRSAIGEAEIKYDLNKSHHFNAGMNNTYVYAKATNLPSEPKQNSTALFAAYGFTGKSEKLRLNISGRQEWVAQLKIPLTFSAGVSYDLLKSTALYAQSAKVYRNPTLNDLYWEPGGNRELLPENGYTHEIGLKWAYKYRYISLSTAPSLFSSRINNWIMWLPEGNIWKPQNIMEVWSRGFETFSEISCQFNVVQLHLSVLTNYVLSGNQKARSPNDNSIDKQLIYVPMYSGYAKFDAGFKKWQLTYRHNYTGYRYLSSDNTQYLEPYMLSSAYLAYTIEIKHSSLQFSLQCYNIFNTEYQVVALRPMALRHFSFGISMAFNKPNN